MERGKTSDGQIEGGRNRWSEGERMKEGRTEGWKKERRGMVERKGRNRWSEGGRGGGGRKKVRLYLPNEVT